MKKQDWKGKQLDKDILVPGNKIYSPENCVFVTNEINSLIQEKAKGYYFYKPLKKYKAQISIQGKITHLGYFESQKKARFEYKKAKNKNIERIANTQPENIKKALMMRL